jgi:hypothetical protein
VYGHRLSAIPSLTGFAAHVSQRSDTPFTYRSSRTITDFILRQRRHRTQWLKTESALIVCTYATPFFGNRSTLAPFCFAKYAAA